MLALVAGEAVAGVAADAVDALPVLAALRVLALVDVRLAARPVRALHAHALETVHTHTERS